MRSVTRTTRVAAATTMTMFCTTSTYCSTMCQPDPRNQPHRMNAVFQIRLPALVSTLKRHSGIRATPAGIEMRLRKIGTKRPKNTALPPWR